MKKEEIYKMKLHEVIELKLGVTNFIITRVAGGWIYQTYNFSFSGGGVANIFVPFSNEFQLREENNSDIPF